MTTKQLWIALAVLAAIVVGIMIFAFDDPSDDQVSTGLGADTSASAADANKQARVASVGS